MRMKLASIAVAMGMIVATTAQANVLPKPAIADTAGLQRVSVPTQNQFRIGKKAPPKHQSLPQTSWICQTGTFWCSYGGPSYIGAPCCCWNGFFCVPGTTTG